MPPPNDLTQANSSPPTVSVVIPAFNVENFIVESIDSVLSQSFGDIEVLVLDDGSTDNTFAQAKAIGDHRLRIWRNACNRGKVFTFNALLASCRGRFICLQDADDVSSPHRISTLLGSC